MDLVLREGTTVPQVFWEIGAWMFGFGVLLLIALAYKHDGALAAAGFTALTACWTLGLTVNAWLYPVPHSSPDEWALGFLVWMVPVTCFLSYLAMTRAHRYLLDNPRARPKISHRRRRMTTSENME